MALERDKALKTKEKGNKLFKEGRFSESVKSYGDAEKYDPTNPVYPSNLSAALYELGDYASCMNAVLRSWSLNSENDPSLTLKLSTRLAKTLSQGVQEGSIAPSVIEQNADKIKELEAVSLKESDSSENAQTWKLWRNIRAGIQHHEDLSYEGKVRLSKMPMFKGAPDPTLTYFVFGTDPVVSLVTDWGSDNADDPINLRALSNDQISKLSFLIAGVGDSRHAFGTLIGLGLARSKLGVAHKHAMKAHITALDIHFASVARTVILFMLVNALMTAREGGEGPETMLEIQATLVYVYVGWIIPSYCHARLMAICASTKSSLLASPPDLPSWLHVDKNSIKPIIRALDFWMTEKTVTASRLLNSMTHRSGTENLKLLLRSNHPGVSESLRSQRVDARRALKTLSDEFLASIARSLRWPNSSSASPKVLRKMLEQNKEDVVDYLVLAQFDKNMELGLSLEAEWYAEVDAFVPPAGLLDRHPGFDAFLMSMEADNGPSKDTKEKMKKLKVQVLKSWKPNITIIDGMEHGLPTAALDAFLIIQHTGLFNKKHGLKSKSPQAEIESPSFSHVATFFDSVIDAIQLMKGNFQIEMICGEVNQELSKVRLGTDSRPPSFPKKFTRIWLSNIPDYTHGTLSTAMCILPALQTDMESAATSNCMWNTPVWKNDDEFCYNYTLLLPKDLERYLGIRTLNGKALMNFLTLSPHPLPRPLNALASRENLYAWLSRLLLSLVSPGMSKARPDLIKLPNNLVAFVRLLVELRNIGYPGHWLSGFMHAVLGGTLEVDHLTYKGSLPRPVSELHQRSPLHRVRLDPWCAELETILVSARHGLPFPVQIPAGASSGANTPDDIGLYKASPAPNHFFSSSMFRFPPNDSVIALLFYKNQSELPKRSVDALITDLPVIVDGRADPPAGTFYVFTAQDYIDLNKPEVRWRMSKALAAKMKREKWFMVAWRMDFFIKTTDPCPASSWITVETPI
ncbi:hypothetical protein GALMADRAFT_250621 [Galerina marginata CBS 339.88]|uniref:DUF4470 domain-containing protein n=1 Tax=Galerina marginata (strain CBS 339.88) TaxID=685588 RepID=A0A067T206_GALM3|nr:hypothetical protein GALMADRAFT_250621 [Galerina marginata CBS 339.88]